jgi:hypothetical protein
MASDETDRLFIARPSEFIGERKTLVKTLKVAGRRQEAASLEKLPRPSLSTWATNQLARREPGLVKELGEVTGRLQTAGSAPDYAGAVAQHRDLFRSLRARAEEILTEAGLRPAPQVLAGVVQNLRAGIVNPATRSLIESGRLVHDVEDSADLNPFEQAISTSPAPKARAATTESAPGGEIREQAEARAARARDDRRVQDQARTAAERESKRLGAVVVAAERVRDKEERALDAARSVVAAAEGRLAAARLDLERELAELRQAEAELKRLE